MKKKLSAGVRPFSSAMSFGDFEINFGAISMAFERHREYFISLFALKSGFNSVGLQSIVDYVRVSI
jgi:hypothetical protein